MRGSLTGVLCRNGGALSSEYTEGNIDTTNISRIESGRTNPTIFTLYRIASALEIPLENLTII
ncbi:helix-turn-helix transcriptional regulator [Myroides marinus]|nr:helix-turn-helix transcriptional regulator [Myroides marinus]